MTFHEARDLVAKALFDDYAGMGRVGAWDGLSEDEKGQWRRGAHDVVMTLRAMPLEQVAAILDIPTRVIR